MKEKTLFLAIGAIFFAINPCIAQDFYASGIQEVRIELPFKNWDLKLDSTKKANPEARMLGKAWINGRLYDSVGVRYKGNSSYFRTRNETFKKLPLNVKLNYKIKSQKLSGGHTTVKLSNAFLDPGFVREPVAYEIIRKYMPAPQCNFSRVYVNGKFYGVYVNSESIDEQFIHKHFGTNNGYLVKCDPDNWKRVRSQSGCPKGENASLTYLNDNTGCYDAFYEVDEAAAWKPLLKLISVLNKTPDKIENHLNVDQALWMLALNNALVNLDSYNGSLSHNYYLWFDSLGVAHPLIWDLNMAFGGWRRNFSFEEMKDAELIQYSPLAEMENARRPLISKLLKNPLYRKIYVAHLKTVATEYLFNGEMLKRAQTMTKEIDPFVKIDSLKLYSYSDFQNAMDKTMKSGPDNVIGLAQLMGKRAEFLKQHPLLNKTAPQISEVKHVLVGDSLVVSARLTGATGGRLYFRTDKSTSFKSVPLTTSEGGLYTAKMAPAEVKHYYILAENADAVVLFPERASYEFLKVD